MTHYTALNENHHVGPARLINERNLRWHLHWDHAVSTKEAKTKAQLGRLHTLAHAVLAHPELRELMGLDKDFGTGKHFSSSVDTDASRAIE